MLFPCLPLFQFAKFIFNFFDFLSGFFSLLQTNEFASPCCRLKTARVCSWALISFKGLEVQPELNGRFRPTPVRAGGWGLQGRWRFSEQDTPGKAAGRPIKYVFMLKRRSLVVNVCRQVLAGTHWQRTALRCCHNPTDHPTNQVWPVWYLALVLAPT